MSSKSVYVRNACSIWTTRHIFGLEWSKLNTPVSGFGLIVFRHTIIFFDVQGLIRPHMPNHPLYIVTFICYIQHQTAPNLGTASCFSLCSNSKADWWQKTLWNRPSWNGSLLSGFQASSLKLLAGGPDSWPFWRECWMRQVAPKILARPKT